jgi:hypothetical protein
MIKDWGEAELHLYIWFRLAWPIDLVWLHLVSLGTGQFDRNGKKLDKIRFFRTIWQTWIHFKRIRTFSNIFGHIQTNFKHFGTYFEHIQTYLKHFRTYLEHNQTYFKHFRTYFEHIRSLFRTFSDLISNIFKQIKT